MARVRQQNGDAIGRAHRHHRARRVFEQGVGLAENSGPALGGHARRGMDLFQQAEAGVESGDIYNARAEAVLQPSEGIQLRNAIDSARVAIGHGQTGFWICAMRTWSLNFASMDSSSRTSVGRFTRVVIFSILSCSFISA